MTTEVTTFPQRAGLIAKIASRYCVEPSKMMDTLKATAFKTDKPITNEQMMALLIVADQHGLNPFTREIFAFPDKNNGITPVVSIDGWARIINEHPQFDGLEFKFADDGSTCTCIIYRRDRSHPISLTEYMAECKRGTQPWSSHPRRMLRHKAMIQCARIAFGFAGIVDPDEAERIAQAHNGERPSAGLEAIRAAIAAPSLAQAEVIDSETGEISTADALPDDKPGKSYAQYADSVVNATSQEAADLELDAARDDLPPDQYQELLTVYKRKFAK